MLNSKHHSNSHIQVTDTSGCPTLHPFAEMSSLANLLQQADIFYQISLSDLELITPLCRECQYQAGEVIFPEGAEGKDLYVIVQGEVDILVDPHLVSGEKEQSSGPFTIATLRRGQSFGEVALVDQGVRSATARAAANNTRVLVIAGEGLLRLCKLRPDLGYHLMRNLAADLALKLRNADMLLRSELSESRSKET